MSKVKFRKIKIQPDGKVFLAYFEEKESGLYDEATLESPDQPNPSFPNALMRLRKGILELCELPTDDEQITSIEVRGLSISHSDKVGMGITLSALKKLKYSDQPLCLNTPHKYEDGDDPKRIMPSWIFNECLVVIEEAQAYLEGDRAQLDMFKQDKREVA